MEIYNEIFFDQIYKKCTGNFFNFFFNNGEKGQLFLKLRILGLDLVCFYFLKYFKSKDRPHLVHR